MIKYWTISAFVFLLVGSSPTMAGSVNAASSTLCTGYDSMAIDVSGNVTITNCNSGSTNASFVVSTASATATTGSPLAVTVTRTVNGGLAGSDNLTLTSTLAGTTFNPITVNFSSTTGVQTSNVTFSTAGSATLLATGAGASNSVTSPTSLHPIVVSANVTGSCSGITAPATIFNLGTLAVGGMGNLSIPTSTDQYAVAAFKFTVPTAAPPANVYHFYYTGGIGNVGKDVNLSECPGDFTGNCVASLADGAYPFTFATSSTAASCAAVLGKTYYMNIRSKTLGLPMSFLLSLGT